ncbi:GNAT family N-acetyltransferase [Pseudogemmobacter sonorensis]|uniref:GNAT family N-acetyltransferase n=1 Tax=Pseudogemmobacter sonorensis TaxID=2989681 RepID=UPI0036C2ECDF
MSGQAGAGGVEIRALAGEALGAALDDVARLRIAVFRDWPYLYDGDLAYERDYLRVYRDSPGALVVGAFDGARLVGAATASPMEDHAAEFAAPLRRIGLPVEQIYYAAESVLLPQYRGRGIGHRFFDLREARARALGDSHMAFCAVIRPGDHPLRPGDARSNEGFWSRRGYARVEGAVAQFAWRDIGATEESGKPLQFWMRRL